MNPPNRPPDAAPLLEPLEPRLLLDAAVTGTVWLDEDRVGFRDDWETGQSGVTVHLLDEALTPVATTTTVGDGDYVFAAVPDGVYVLEVVAPLDRYFSPRLAADPDGFESDVDRLTGRTDPFTVDASSDDLVFDAGLMDASGLVLADLRVTELMYNPPPGYGFVSYEFEFIELANTGPFPLDLTGVRFIDGVAFDFTGSGVTVLAPDQRTLVVKNREAFESRYDTTGLSIAGEYDGRLNDDGEAMRLVGPINREIYAFFYRSSAATRRTGYSLEPCDIPPYSWIVWSEAGTVPGGTPGLAEADAVATAAVGGTVVNATNGHGIPNVAVRLRHMTTGAFVSTKTNHDGRYDLFGVVPWNYELQVQRLDGTWQVQPGFGLVDREYKEMPPVNLIAHVPLAHVRGDLWMDLNGDGIRGDDLWQGEVTVILRDGADEVVAVQHQIGEWFEFRSLLPGDYTLQVAAYRDLEPTLKDQGTDEYADNDFDPETGRTDPFTLAPGQFEDSIGAGFVYASGAAYLEDYLRVTEMMVNPAPAGPGEPAVDKDEFEFIELANTGSLTADLTGVRFINGIAFDFADSTVTELAPGGRLVVVNNLAAFQGRYDTAGMLVAGEYDGRLRNEGERVTLVAPINREIHDCRYDTAWVVGTAAHGFSMTLVNDSADPVLARNWRPSSVCGGTPGAPDETLVVLPAGVVINEALTHPDAGGLDAIELFNTTAATVPIGGWVLFGGTGRYAFPVGAQLAAGEYLLLDETDFNPSGGADPNDIELDAYEAGGLLLAEPDAGLPIRDYVTFSASDQGVTFGRHVTSTGGVDFVATAEPTLGHVNAPPGVGPVVINEIMYHPLTGQPEWIELANLTGEDVPLGGAGAAWWPHWLFNDGIEWEFWSGEVIPARGYAVVVDAHPESFRAAHGIPESVPVYGSFWWGTLDNQGETLTLARRNPAPPDRFDLWAYEVRIDHVTYSPLAPWPTEPNGLGPSLERVVSADYGSDVANWAAGPPGGTPGAPNAAGPPCVVQVELNDRPGRSVSDIEPSGIGVRTIDVTFSEAVNFAAEDVTVQTVTFPGGVEAISETLTPAVEQPAPDAMRITLGDPVGAVDTWVKVTLSGTGTITDATGNPLDGEARSGIAGRGYIFDSLADLPSGDGTPGGDAVFYVGSLRADLCGFGPGAEEPNGTVESWDINGFTQKYVAGDLDADFRGFGPAQEDPNGTVDSWDINGFTSRYIAAIAAGTHLDDLPTAGGQGMAAGGPSPLPLLAAEPTLKALPEVAVLASATRQDWMMNAPDTPTGETFSGTDFVAEQTFSAGQPAVTPAISPLTTVGDKPSAEEHGDATATPWAGTDAPSAAGHDPSVDVELPDLLALPALDVLNVP